MKKPSLLLVIILTVLSFAYSQESNVSITVFANTVEAEYQAGNDTTIVFNFDEESANKNNGWIEIYFDGEMARMRAGGELEAPFSFDIPGIALTPGEHNVEFKILSRDQGNPSAIVEAEIIIKAVK